MSSILTNNSAMVALQTLQSVNSNLAKTQDMISTGKAVADCLETGRVAKRDLRRWGPGMDEIRDSVEEPGGLGRII